VEAPDLRPAGAIPQATGAWDASVCARPDAAADVLHLELRSPPADDAERLVGRARDVRERHALHRQSELLAAPAAEQAAKAPCTRVLAQSAERSSLAPVAVAQLNAPESKQRAPRKQMQMQMEVRRLEAFELQTAPRGVPAVRLRASMPVEAQLLGAWEQPEPSEMHSRKLPAALWASPAAAQPSLGGSLRPGARLQVFPPEHVSLSRPRDAEPPVRQPPSSA
jgi:hypothetical protein